jgi:hypothetical protein
MNTNNFTIIRQKLKSILGQSPGAFVRLKKPETSKFYNVSLYIRKFFSKSSIKYQLEHLSFFFLICRKF